MRGGGEVVRSAWLALVTLFAGYLEDGSRYDPYRPENLCRSTLLRHIEYLRTRLDNAGVPNMMGWNALTNLTEYVLTTGIITKDDLRLIPADRLSARATRRRREMRPVPTAVTAPVPGITRTKPAA